jgi:hypothetical protein
MNVKKELKLSGGNNKREGINEKNERGNGRERNKINNNENYNGSKNII